MTAAVDTARTLSRRLLPLQIGVGLQGFMLWVAVEKLFLTTIGFDAASIGVMAAAYAAVVPLLEVPSGILADRWSRKGILVLASVALAATSLVGGISTNVATYVVSAMILGVYFAMYSGTADSVVYDTVLEQTGSSDEYERQIGRVRLVEGTSLAVSALVGGVLAGWTSSRLTYFATVPFALLSIVALLALDEPRLNRAAEPVALRRHIAITLSAMTRQPRVRQVILLTALAGLLSQAVFEFGPLWLVARDTPATVFGPYWAVLVASLGLGGYVTSKLHLDRSGRVFALAGLLAATPLLLAATGSLVAVIVGQTVLQLLLAVVAIHAGLLLHDQIPSTVRAGVSSGVGTFTWLLFLPFSVGFGWLLSTRGLRPAAWVLVAGVALLAALFALSARPGRRPASAPAGAPPTDVACRELVTVVSDYLDGVLPADWRAGTEAHLGNCEGCSRYLEQIRALVDALEQLDATAGRPLPGAEPAER